MIRRNSNLKSFNFRKVYYIFLVLLLSVIAVYLLFSNWRVFGKMVKSIKQKNMVENNLASLSVRENDLVKKIGELETENGLEKEIRERFPVAKPGEEVIMIVKGEEGGLSGNDVSSDDGWLKRFLNWIKE